MQNVLNPWTGVLDKQQQNIIWLYVLKKKSKILDMVLVDLEDA